MSDEVALERLYDAHAARLFAVARRITGDDGRAAAVLEEVFADVASGRERHDPTFGSDGAWLLRLTRDRCLAGNDRLPAAAVGDQGAASPRSLIEEVFFAGATVDDLANRHGLTPAAVRELLRSGMTEWRKQFAATAGKR